MMDFNHVLRPEDVLEVVMASVPESLRIKSNPLREDLDLTIERMASCPAYTNSRCLSRARKQWRK